MAVTIDATVGGASANSYVTLAEFTTYMDGRSTSTAFDGATVDEQNRALVSATRRLEQEPYKGHRIDSAQALAWPRKYVPVADPAHSDETATLANHYDADEIPERVKRAQMELAYSLLAGEFALADTGLEGFTNVQIGSLNVTPNHQRRAGELPEGVRRELRPLVLSGRNTVRLMRG